MAKAVLTLDEVINAARQVIAAGEKPTIAKVHETLGNRGSATTVSRMLKEWRESVKAKASSEDKAEEVPKAVITKSPKKKPHADQSDEETADSKNALEMYNIPSKERLTNKPKKDRDNQRQPRDRYDNKQRKGYQQDKEGRQKRRTHRKQQVDKHQQQMQHHMREYKDEPYEQFILESKPIDIEMLDKPELINRIRRLEGELMKEQSRRQAAERLSVEAQQYAELIKAEVGDHVNDLKLEMDEQINQLKQDIRDIQVKADQDLCEYRAYLEKANQALAVLKKSQETKG